MAITSLTEVAEHNFRSLEEIDRYVDDLKKRLTEYDGLIREYEKQFARFEETSAPLEFKINVKEKTLKPLKRREGQHILIEKKTRVRIPKLERLKKNFAIVEELYDKLDILRNLESQVALHFDKKPGAPKTLQGIRSMKKITEQKVKKALEFLEKIGKKYEPKQFKEFIQKVADKLEDEVEYSGFENLIYVHQNKKNDLQFTHYLKLEDVKDDEGRTFPELYVVFTNLLEHIPGTKKVMSRYYVTTLYEFQTPEKFDVGTAVDSAKGAILIIGMSLDLELNFSSQLGVLPLGLEDQKITKDRFSVKQFISSIGIDERSIEFNLIKGIKSQADAEDVVNRLFNEVKLLLVHVKAKLKVRLTKELGRYKAVFTLSNLAGPGQVSVEDIKPLMEKLGIEEEDKMRKIVRIINSN